MMLDWNEYQKQLLTAIGEIVEALGVAIAVNAGATLVYSARVIDAFAAKIPVDK